jgi:hypothetical protein
MADKAGRNIVKTPLSLEPTRILAIMKGHQSEQCFDRTSPSQAGP